MMETEDGNMEDLVRQADQMMAAMHGDSDLPRVNRSLQQMRQFSEHLCARGPPSHDANAARLLGSRGYELPGPLSQKLEMLSSLKTYESLEPYADTDIAVFLKNERENALLAAVEQTRRQTFTDSERRCLRAVREWWDKEKQQVLSTLANAGSLPGTGDLPDSLAPQMYSGSRQDIVCGGIRTTMSQIEMAYARQVDLYHSESLGLLGFSSPQAGLSPATKAGGSYKDFCSRLLVFIQQQQPGDAHASSFVEFWRMIDCVSDLPRAVGPRNLVEARASARVQRAGVRRALTYLESEFIEFMKAAVSANPREARLGGVPGTRSFARAFISLRPPHVGFSEMQDGQIDGKPVWALIYLCMRGGDLQEALQIAKEASNNLGDFIPLLEEYVKGDRTLSSASRATLLTRYKRNVRSGGDPFKRAVYCVLGGCEPTENHPDVASSIDDFLWLKLSQLHWPAEEDVGGRSWTAQQQQTKPSHGLHGLSDDTLTLERLQKMLLEEFGEVHFDADQQPLLYFKVLFLTLHFETAIAFLSRFESLRCHAVHAALALHDRRILLLPESPQAQLLCTESGDNPLIRRLNLARLVMIYTRKFEVTDPREALNYYFFLRDLKIGSDNSLFSECVAQLAVDSKEVELLFGKLDDSGVRKPGAVDRFGVEISPLLLRVAKLLESRGLPHDAVSVYELSGKLEEAVRLLNQLLTEVVSHSPDDVARRHLKETGSRLAMRLRAGDSVPGDAVLFHLLDLLTFFDLAHTNQVEAALTVIDAMRLLPSSEMAVDARLKAFEGLPEEVRRVTPRLLLAVMRCLMEKKRQAQLSARDAPPGVRLASISSPAVTSQAAAVLNELRGRSKALLVYAGRLPYRMPGDVYSQLTQMEIEMGCQ